HVPLSILLRVRLVLILFLYRYGVHRPLHSFPTRRSSDLYGTFIPTAFGTAVDVGQGNMIPGLAVDQYAATFARWLGVADSDVSRSEEHTSELQSLTNLVCRLLLDENIHCCTTFASTTSTT